MDKEKGERRRRKKDIFFRTIVRYKSTHMSIDLTVGAYCSFDDYECMRVIFYGSYDDQGEVQIRSDSWYIE